MSDSEDSAAPGVYGKLVLDRRLWRKGGAFCFVRRQRVLLIRGESSFLDLHLLHVSGDELPAVRSRSIMWVDRWMGPCEGLCSGKTVWEEAGEGEVVGSSASRILVVAAPCCSCMEGES